MRNTDCTSVLVASLLLITPSTAIFPFDLFQDNEFNPRALDRILGVPPTPPTTTENPECTTQNAFQRAGWETDDKGNVFAGTDEAKLLLISVGSYWPFPKDYRKKRNVIKEC